MLLDDHAHRGYKGCKEAGDHQQVADVEGGGRCQGARPQEGEGSWDAGEDWQVRVGVGQHVSTDHGHAQQELQNPEDFDHFEKPLLLHRITTFSGTLHTAPASHFCNGDWLTNEVGLLNWLTLAWLAGWPGRRWTWAPPTLPKRCNRRKCCNTRALQITCWQVLHIFAELSSSVIHMSAHLPDLTFVCAGKTSQAPQPSCKCN